MAFDYGIYLLMALLFVFVFYGRLEWLNHQKNIDSISLRIVVNGTRGKSTVTRLLGAVLKAGGYHILAKTTGTKPRMIIDNKTEIPVIRPGKANIHEQLAIMKKAAKEKANAIVFENMSVRPDLQWIEESKIINPHIVLITNVRADHLEVMGPTLTDIATNFVKAVPDNAIVFTAEKKLFPLLQKLCARRGIKTILSNDDNVSEKELKRFPYFEHRENVALVLEVCKFLNIPRDRALSEMYGYIPDSGILKKYELLIASKRVSLYNALAANDPDSTFYIYQRIEKPEDNFYILVNCRADRIDRSVQMAKLVSNKIGAERYFVTGGETKIFCRTAIKHGIPKQKIVDLGSKKVDFVFDRITEVIKDNCTILAIGNIVGYGEALIDFFVKKRDT